MTRTVVLLTLTLTGGAQAQTHWQATSYADIGGWQRVQSWCDTPGRVLAVTLPDQSGNAVKLAQWVGGKINVQHWHLGRPDPGAGQIYTPLVPAGQRQGQPPDYFIHSSNIENTRDPHYRMTHINAYVVPAGRFQCRYVPQAAVLAATARHTVIVWEEGTKFTYASRNRDGTPGLRLTGGTHTRTDAGHEQYRWTIADLQYVLDIGRSARAGGSLSVLKGGRRLSREEILACTISVPK
ncbi:hypothetical protein GCM10010840_22610 [Deinococcus aerolatus]|uniref:Uncharacterized protein n=1 Tax=Deinococcus aerolatus TaxID=522487 RepID=A0ABQ2GBH1_9DEIO|nr:hypothetical protein [Deinococcus aerolatus]GGL84315.1 hypothetical protein GCM10010840_22610 [Deinococcus aerolatus]